MSGKAVIIGATASLGVALCRRLAAQGRALLLVGREEESLLALAADLKIRGAQQVDIRRFDLLRDMPDGGEVQSWGEFTSLFMLAGDMGSGEQDDPENIRQITQVNYTAPAQLLALAAARLQTLGGGEIAVVSSVAGDRGRQSNYEYGAAKAALTAFAAGLRNRYAKQGVQVLTVKPGFIDTPMTFGLQSPLLASRERVAADILAALKSKHNVIYTPWFWRIIMLVIRHIPECIFKRMKL